MSGGMNSRINPQVMDVTIGIRNLREIKIYPLSIYDQTQFGNLLSKVLAKVFNIVPSDTEGTATIMGEIVEEVTNNLFKMIDLVTDEDGEELSKEITNEQALDLAMKVFKVNYEPIIKKVQGLLKETEGSSILEKLLNLFAGTTTMPQNESSTDLSEEEA